MKRIAVYYRVSTDEQDTKSQRNAVEQWLSRLENSPSVQVFEDIKSGKDTNRPAYQQMIAMCKARQFDTVVVYRLDRFGRDASKAMRMILELSDYSVAFVSVTEPALNLAHDNPMRLILIAAISTFAQLERNAIRDRIKAGMAVRRSKGLRLGAEVKATADVIMKARALRQNGSGYRAIAKALGLSVGTAYKAVNGE